MGSLGGCADAFAAKLTPDGSRLVYSIYYGTSGPDAASGIAANPAGGAWVTGTANNAIFLLKLSPEGRQEFVRTIPAYPLAQAHALALDRLGNVYITGDTLGPLPLMRPPQDRMGAPSCTAAGGTTAMPLDAFVMKFNATGEMLYPFPQRRVLPPPAARSCRTMGTGPYDPSQNADTRSAAAGLGRMPARSQPG